VNQRNRFILLLGAILVIAIVYYFLSTNRGDNLVVIGTVDANQVIVSPKITGRIEKLNIDDGTRVKVGDVIAELDTAELSAAERAALATAESLQSQIAAQRANEVLTHGQTTSNVDLAQARLQSVKAQLRQAQADLERQRLDTHRAVQLAEQGVASQQDRDRAEAALKVSVANVQSLADQVNAAQADLQVAIAQTHQQHVATSNVAATRAQALTAQQQALEAKARLSYATVTAPVTGVVSLRAARQGEVVNPGQAIATIVDLSDTWVWAPIPETYADKIQLGDTLTVQLPSGATTQGKVTYKAVAADFATQRDVSRRKRDIRTVELKVAVDNANEKFVPGMTATVLIPWSKLESK
jgi:HlyD family secretion protein